MPVLDLEEAGIALGVADIGFCEYGGDHVQLVHDARADRERLSYDVKDSSVLCGRCRCLVPLDCRVL